MTTSNKNKLNNGAILKNFKSQIIEKQSEIVDIMTVVIGSMSIMGVC